MVDQPEVGKIWLMPPPSDKCQTCASDHFEEQPHNAQTMYYQVQHKLKTGEDPSWLTAMAHCHDRIKELWTAALTAKGVDVAGGGINPSVPPRRVVDPSGDIA